MMPNTLKTTLGIWLNLDLIDHKWWKLNPHLSNIKFWVQWWKDTIRVIEILDNRYILKGKITWTMRRKMVGRGYPFNGHITYIYRNAYLWDIFILFTYMQIKWGRFIESKGLNLKFSWKRMYDIRPYQMCHFYNYFDSTEISRVSYAHLI